MSNQEIEDRILMLKKIQKESPESFREEYAQSIEEGVIAVGMTPFEANLAGGAFTYKVVPDKKWPKDMNPLKIMWAQTNQPDDSEIVMTFNNNRQFRSIENITFKVFIEQGRVLSIEKS